MPRFLTILLLVLAVLRLQAQTQPPASQTIPLELGWNLVSIQVGGSITPAAFKASLPNQDEDRLVEIWGYDPSGNPAVPGSWKVFRFGTLPVGFPNDLATISPGRGYWIKTGVGRTTATLMGAPWDGAVSIRRGWNLVGFPGLAINADEIQELSAVFGTSFNRIQQVWGHDAPSNRFLGYDTTAIPQLKELAAVAPAKGYWVYSIADTDLSLSPSPFVALPSDSDASPPQAATLYTGVDPKYVGKQVRLRAGDGSDTPYDLNANGILDDTSTQDTILFEKTADTVSITIGNLGSGICTWSLENSVPWLFTAPGDDRTWPTGATSRPVAASGTVSSEKDTLLLYANRAGMTPGRKTADITLWVGGQAHSVHLLLDVASVDGDWRGYATTTRVGGRNVSLGEVRLALNSFALGNTAATATATASGGQITAISVVNGGTGYESVPAVVISGTGTGATAVATVANKVVTSISVTSPGSGYTGTPTVTLSSPTDSEANGFRAVLNREQSILFPRDVYMDGVFYASNQFKLSTNFEMKAGDRNAPPYDTFPSDAKDRDVNGDGKVDAMNPFPFGLRREVTLIGTRVSQNRLEGSYIESIRGMLPPLGGSAPTLLEVFRSDAFLTQSQPVFIEGTFVLERQSFTPSQRSIVNTTVTPGITFGGSSSGSRTETVDVDTTANVNGVITVTLDIALGEIDPALLRISLVSPSGTSHVLHDYASALAGSYTLPAGTFVGESADGAWELLIEWDDTSGERATLNSWGLKIEAVSSHSASGRLINATTQNTIPGISIRVEGGVTTFSTVTDPAGLFTFPGLTENDYTLFINAPGYENYSLTFFVGEEDVDLEDIELVPRTVTVAGVEAAPLLGYDELQVELEALVPLSYASADVSWDFGDGSPLLTGPLSSQATLEDGTVVPLIAPTHRYRQGGDFVPKATFSGGGITTTIKTGPMIHVQVRHAATIDTSLKPAPGGNVLTLLPFADRSTIIGGSFSSINGQTWYRIARILPDGQLDQSFKPYVSSTVNTVLRQADGKLILGGSFTLAGDTSAGAITRNRLARFNPDGTFDSSFDPNANGTVNSLAQQSDGKIIVGGSFTTMAGLPRSQLARLNPDGTLDLAFDPNVGGSSVVSVVVQPDDRILIGGGFGTVSGVTKTRLTRLLATGQLDPAFTTTASATVQSIVLDAQGRIYLGGSFGSVGGISHPRLARLLPTGAVDATFNPNLDNTVYSVLPLPDGKVLAGGIFTQANGTARTRFARFLSDGSLDAGFDLPADERVSCLALQPDRRVMIGGIFTNIGGQSRSRLARLHPEESQIVRGIGIGSIAARMDVGANTSGAAPFSVTNVQNSFTEGSVTVNMNSATVYQESQWDSATFDLDRQPFGTTNWVVSSSLEDSDYGRSGGILNPPGPATGQVFVYYNTSATDNGTTATDEKWDARAYSQSPLPTLTSIPASLNQSPGSYELYTPANSNRPDRLRMAVTLGGAVLGTQPSQTGDIRLLPGRTLK